MKHKKWSELEEQTLWSKYSDLLNSGTLSKLKTIEKKFKPIADHVNSIHHLQDPVTVPFNTWGVKQKIRISKDEFNWKDGDNHWENLLKYEEVFLAIWNLKLEGRRVVKAMVMGVICLRIVLNWGLQLVVRILRRKRKTMASMGMMAVTRRSDLRVSLERRGNSEILVSHIRKSRKGAVGSNGFGLLGTQVLELEWKERLLGLQIEHEKGIMQTHMEAIQNQMQIRFMVRQMMHPGGLGDNGKPDSSSPSEFI
ncbi:hypothetical protein GQ457_03G028780 [Hibiscus cannabinus]